LKELACLKVKVKYIEILRESKIESEKMLDTDGIVGSTKRVYQDGLHFCHVPFSVSSDLMQCNRCFRHFDFYPPPVTAGYLFALHPMSTACVKVAVKATTAVSQTVTVICTSRPTCHAYTAVGIVISTVIVRPSLTRQLANRVSSLSQTISGMNIVEVDVVVASIDSVVVMVREIYVRITACVPHSCQP
jgi:hypothetical protein